MKVLVLGGTGMLGSMVAKVLPDEWEVLVTARTPAPYPYELVNTWWRRFEVGPTSWIEDLKELADGCNWIVNCLGTTKPLILLLLEHVQNYGMMGEDAARTCNEQLPMELVKLGPPVIHASTDCVFSGNRRRPYDEMDEPDAIDPYGRTKAAGEAPGAIVLRCSLVGPECRSPARYLLGKTIEGYVRQGWTDHLWNGLTTLAWARIVMAIMEHQEAWPPGSYRLQHLVPSGSCSKERLVSTILQAHEILNQIVEPTSSVNPADTRLSTIHGHELQRLWKLAGYDPAPTIEQMLYEQAEFCGRELWPSHAEGWRYWRQ